MFLHASSESKWPWLQKVGTLPLMGPFLMLIFSSWPVSLGLFLAGLLNGSELAGWARIVPWVVAAVWSGGLWKFDALKFRLLGIPMPILLLVLGVLDASGVFHK